MRSPAPIVAIILLAAAPAQAQALRDFCADRPGKGMPPCVLDVGHTQLETGLADAVFQRSGGVHSTIYTIAASQVRFGLTPTLEAGLTWSPLIVDRERGLAQRTGSGDLTLGLLTALTAPGADGPAVSLQGFVTAPTATHGLGAGGWSGGVRLPAQLALGPNLALGLTPEVDVVRNAAGGGTHLALVSAAGLTRTVGKLSLEVEAWGAVDDDPSGRTYQASADFAAALAVGSNGQLDAGANFGLNRATPGVEVYFGVARRF